MIIDSHVHISHPHTYALPAAQSTPEGVIGLMDMDRIDVSVIQSLASYWGENRKRLEVANDDTAEAIRKYPDRFVGFAWAHPWGKEHVIEEIRRCVKVLKFKGVKLHPATQFFHANSQIAHPIIEECIKLRVPVMIHTGHMYCGPMLIADLADRFPEASLIMAHMGHYRFANDAIIAAKWHDNIVVEPSHVEYHAIQSALKVLGAERIVFGSDAPLTRPANELRKLDMCHITEEDREKILWKNAVKILGLTVRGDRLR